MRFPTTLLEAIQYFSDEQVCIDFVAAMKWPDGKATCPQCMAQEPYYLATQRRWKCRKCYKQFSVKVHTIFEDSPLSLQKWLPAMWLLANCKNGISSWELHRALGVGQKAAWFMLQRIRLAFKNGSLAKLGGDGGPVEVDETYIAPDTRKMHNSRRRKRQTTDYWKRKPIVMGMVDRETRKVRAMTIPNAKRETLQAAILNGIETGSTVYTDDFVGYDQLLLKGYLHQVINHTKEYVRGQVHTQGIDNFWSLLKRGLTGTYIAVEPFHLDRYVDEQAFRYNNRAKKDNPLTDADRFALAVSQIAGKRLTYAELTGKTDAASSA
jgi:transposase-like protein